MKRILFISPRLTSGGAERQMVTVARLLKHKGYSVEVLCYSYGDFYEEYLKEASIPVHWVQHNNLLRLATCTWFLHRRHYDVVISFLPTPSFINCFAAMLSKRWKVITGERSSLVKKPTNMIGRFGSWLRRYSDAIVCNSHNACNLWKERFPKYRNNMRTIYNIVELGPVTSTYKMRAGGKTRIVVAATIYGVKNPKGVAEALMMLQEDERQRIAIDWYGSNQAEIGDTRDYDEVCELIKQNGLQGTLRLHGATIEIQDKMNEADCVALFSKYEGLPNAICEGMMAGKPVIMTRVSDYNTLIVDGKNGFLCDADDVSSIAETFRKLMNVSNQKLESMGKASKEMAERLFSSDRIIKEWINLIEN